MRIFRYRQPRLSAGFNVEFILTGQTFQGRCRDVSDAGIRAEFNGTIDVGETGMLVLRHPMRVLRLEAEVAYLGKGGVGLSFIFDSQQQRDLTIQFISQITT
jgi:PilZ domain